MCSQIKGTSHIILQVFQKSDNQQSTCKHAHTYIGSLVANFSFENRMKTEKKKLCATFPIPIVCMWRQLWLSIKWFGLHSILNWICLVKSCQRALPQIIIIIKCNTQRNENGIRTPKSKWCMHITVDKSCADNVFHLKNKLIESVLIRMHSFPFIQFARNALWLWKLCLESFICSCTLVANRNRFAMEFNRDKLHDLLL